MKLRIPIKRKVRKITAKIPIKRKPVSLNKTELGAIEDSLNARINNLNYNIWRDLEELTDRQHEKLLDEKIRVRKVQRKLFNY